MLSLPHASGWQDMLSPYMWIVWCVQCPKPIYIYIIIYMYIYIHIQSLESKPSYPDLQIKIAGVYGCSSPKHWKKIKKHGNKPWFWSIPAIESAHQTGHSKMIPTDSDVTSMTIHGQAAVQTHWYWNSLVKFGEIPMFDG
jgi:hypothetical protein